MKFVLTALLNATSELVSSTWNRYDSMSSSDFHAQRNTAVFVSLCSHQCYDDWLCDHMGMAGISDDLLQLLETFAKHLKCFWEQQYVVYGLALQLLRPQILFRWHFAKTDADTNYPSEPIRHNFSCHYWLHLRNSLCLFRKGSYSCILNVGQGPINT